MIYDQARNVQIDGVVAGRLDVKAAGTFVLSDTSTGVSPRWAQGPRGNSQPSYGLVGIGPDGAFRYEPDAESVRTGGPDTFTVVAGDFRGRATFVPVGVVVAPSSPTGGYAVTVNDAITAGGVVGGTVVGGEGRQGITFTADTSPEKGRVEVDPATGRFTYVPSLAARHRAAAREATSTDLTDSFTILVSGGRGGSFRIPVSIALEPYNTKPEVALSSAGLNVATGGVTTAVTGRDGDEDALSYIVTRGPSFGSVSPVAAGPLPSGDSLSFTYTPTDAARRGAAREGPRLDNFTVTVDDGHGGMVDTVVVVGIAPLNADPVVSVGMMADGVSATITGSDPDGDVLAYTVTAGPVSGSVTPVSTTGASAVFTYTPTAAARHAAAGGGPVTDGFVVTVTDGYGGSVAEWVTVAIAPANAVPAGFASANAPDLSGVVGGAVTGFDTDGDVLFYSLAGGPANGAVSLNAVTGAFVYTPTAVARHAAAGGGAATDGFTVRISDGFGGSVDVPVTLAIGPVNAIPVASFAAGSPDAVSGLVSGSVSATDADGDALVYTVSGGPAGGSVSLDAVTGAFSYIPTPAARQGAASAGPFTDAFTVVITDGYGGSVNQVVSVGIAPVLGCVGCAFVASSASNTVTAIDTDTNTVVASIPGGSGPFGVAVNPDGTRVYVSNDGGNTVSVINAVTNTLLTSITVGANPRGIAITSDGNRVYVTNRGANTVSVINTATNAVIATVPVGSYPNWIAISPDGSKAYVNNYFSNSVSVINIATNTVVATIGVGVYPFGVAFNPAGTRAYVANQGGGVSVIDTATNAVTATIAVGSGPFAVAFNPSGTRAYVTNHYAGTVSVIDTTTNAVTATITVGTNPSGVGVSPDGTRLYVAVGGNPSSVKVIDTATNTLLTSFTVANGPSILAMSPL